MSHNYGVQAQWSLTKTSDATIAVAKGILIASTSDNIQPLALMTVQALGTTLAICQDTKIKVETKLGTCRGSHVVRFLKSTIGYAEGDAVDVLLQSNNGVCFLGLAVALMTWSSFEAAKALDSMLTSSAASGQLLPTILQLQDLLITLESKLSRLGFADLLIHWHMVLKHRLTTAGPLDDLRDFLEEMSMDKIPSADGLNSLVDAFRSVKRIGEGVSVQIRAGAQCTWIIAFTEWCFGYAPRIVTERGLIILEEATCSEVEVCLALGELRELEVRVFHDLQRPAELWAQRHDNDQVHLQWTGMVSVQQYAKRYIFDSGLAPEISDLGYRALLRALVHSTWAVMSNVDQTDAQESPTERKIPEEDLPNSRKVLFPSARRVAETLQECLGEPSREKCFLKRLKPGREVGDLVLVSQYVTQIKQQCVCSDCSDDPSSQDECAADTFQHQITMLTAQILAISLFECIEPIRLYFRSYYPMHGGSGPLNFISRVGRIVFPSSRYQQKIFQGQLYKLEYRSGEFTDQALDMALWLVGHDNQDKDLYRQRWIASSQKGQVVYPTLLETLFLDSGGLLRLCGGPGVLLHGRQAYEKVLGCLLSGERRIPVEVTTYDDVPVTKPDNLHPNTGITWKVWSPRAWKILD